MTLSQAARFCPAAALVRAAHAFVAPLAIALLFSTTMACRESSVGGSA